MFTALYVDGSPVGLSDPEVGTVSLEFGTGDGVEFRCRACGEDLMETLDGMESEPDGVLCPDAEPLDDDANKRHAPERIPLSWCNRASITADPDEDSVTVAISVGDPRGAFTFTIRRIPDDVAGPLAGRLVAHLPHPGEPMPHAPVREIRPGTLLIGPVPADVR